MEEVMKLKKIGLLLSVAAIALAAAACGNNAGGDAGTSTPPQNNTQEETQKPEEIKAVTIKHELDETTLNVGPEKVMVFDYGVLDALDALEIDVIGLPKSNIPEYLNKYSDEKYADVGTLFEPNFEKIFEMKPDLIIISARQKDLYEEFKAIAPTVYVPLMGNDYMSSFKSNMSILAQIFGIEDKVNVKVSEIETAIKDLNGKVTASGKNALFIMANEGNLSAYGQDSRFGMLYDDFGFIPVDENIDASTHGNKISFEYIVEKNPDYIFVLDRGAVAKTSDNMSAEKLLDNDLMKTTSAYQNGNITYVDPHVWYVATGGINGTLTMVNEVEGSIK